MQKEQKTSVSVPEFERSPIDIHSHFSHGTPSGPPVNGVHVTRFDFIEAVYDSASISQAGFSTFESLGKNTECIAGENVYLHNLTKEKAFVYQWVVIDPRQPETYRQAEEMLPDPKVLGIKIHPDYHGYDILDHADGLFSFADARKAVVLMHPQHIPDMPAFADKYPDMKLIIAHLGSPDHVNVIRNARHGNIYTDTSGSASSLNNILEYAVERVGSEKILFGTDTYSYAFQFGRVALSNLPLQDKENILWKNAVRLFGRAFG